MMKQLLRLSFLGLFCISFQLNAQNIAQKVSDDKGHPRMVVFEKSAPYNLTNPRQVLQDHLKISQDYQFSKTKSETDHIGFTHERYQQYYRGLKVEFAKYTLHGQNNKVTSISGEFYEIGAMNLSPTISAEQAFQKALNHVNAQNYLWEYPEAAEAMDNYQKPEGELLILPLQNIRSRTKSPYRLAYKFDIYATNPISRGYVYIDAHSGDMLLYNAIIKHAGEHRHAADARKELKDHVEETAEATATAKKLKTALGTMVAGSGDTRYSGTRTIETRNEGGYYSLNDDSRSVFTRNANNQAPGFSYPYINNYTEFTDNDNNWTSGEHSANKDDAALDAHWGAMMTYDYWQNVHSRNSYDNSGAQIRSYVHVDSNYDNAFWNGSVMSYGDGSSNGNEGNGYFDALTSIDVVAHEIGHAVCTSTADLVYSYESGAMNEGFSDIWGAAIEHYAKGNGSDSAPDISVWLIGDEIDRRAGSAALRSMNDPNSLGDPDTYQGSYWNFTSSDNGGVHTNSGVLNHWFYLLAAGGSGTNDNGDSYNVSGIGMAAAANIAYRLESVYLSSNSQYADGRTFGIQSAIDLYGAGSAEEIAVTNAWYAVGVGSEYGAPPSYCNSASTNVNDEYISRVQLAGIDNSSGAQFYSDFTAISTALSANTNYTITITPTWTGTVYAEGYAVWIDYNQDRDFDDAGELVFSAAASTNTPVSGQFTVPVSATEGATRMRVSMKYNAIPTSCETFTYGEVEDYTVDIGGGGPPPPDTTPPVITLIGNASIDLNVGDPYVEQNATALDDTDGDISASIVIGGDTVDTSTPGVYVVTYNVSDAAGNAADEVTRTVTVNDVGGGGTDILHEGYFESGWDGWQDGGSDCYRYGGSRSYEGNYSIRIRDNSGTSSSMTLSGVNVSGYNTITVDFAFYSYSMENGEDFWLQYYDGSGWNTVATYARGTDFNNNTFNTASVNISSGQYSFPSNAGFRFRCDASANADHIYIDAVVISASSGAGFAQNTIQEIPGNYGFGDNELSGNEREEEYLIYPNPIRNMLTIERMDDTPATYEIMDMSGKTVKTGKLSASPVNVSGLKAGVYIVKIDDGEEVTYKKIIKQ